MEIKDFIEIAKAEWSVLAAAPFLVLALIAVVASLIWWLKGSIDDGQIKQLNAHIAGLKAQLDVRDERMRLAEEKREEVQKTAERLSGQVSVLTAQLQQHAAPAEIERTAGIIQSTTTALSSANTALHNTLRPKLLESPGFSSDNPEFRRRASITQPSTT